jgi:hypothetical protein
MGSQHVLNPRIYNMISGCDSLLWDGGIILAGRDTELDSGSWKCVLWMKYTRPSSTLFGRA